MTLTVLRWTGWGFYRVSQSGFVWCFSPDYTGVQADDAEISPAFLTSFQRFLLSTGRITVDTDIDLWLRWSELASPLEYDSSLNPHFPHCPFWDVTLSPHLRTRESSFTSLRPEHLHKWFGILLQGDLSLPHLVIYFTYLYQYGPMDIHFMLWDNPVLFILFLGHWEPFRWLPWLSFFLKN